MNSNSTHIVLLWYMQSVDTMFCTSLDEAKKRVAEIGFNKHFAREPEIVPVKDDELLYRYSWRSDYDGGGNDMCLSAVPESELRNFLRMSKRRYQRIRSGRKLSFGGKFRKGSYRYSFRVVITPQGTVAQCFEKTRVREANKPVLVHTDTPDDVAF